MRQRRTVRSPVVAAGCCLRRELDADCSDAGLRDPHRTRTGFAGEGRTARHAAADAHGAQRHVRQDRARARTSSRLPTTRRSVPRLDVEYRGLRCHGVARPASPEGTDGKTAFTPDTDLQPTTVFYWRARAVQGTATGPWSDTGTFRSKLVGFIRAGELYDPLIHGETVGRAGRVDDVHPGQGHPAQYRPELRQVPAAADHHQRRVLDGRRRPARQRARRQGEGVRDAGRARATSSPTATASTSSTAARPARRRTPSQWRVLYGSARRPERPLRARHAKRNASVFLLNPSTMYHWKATWGSDFRLVVREGGVNGGDDSTTTACRRPGARTRRTRTTRTSGAPTGRSGGESASIAGTIYRNVWLSTGRVRSRSGLRSDSCQPSANQLHISYQLSAVSYQTSALLASSQSPRQ